MEGVAFCKDNITKCYRNMQNTVSQPPCAISLSLTLEKQGKKHFLTKPMLSVSYIVPCGAAVGEAGTGRNLKTFMNGSPLPWRKGLSGSKLQNDFIFVSLEDT